MTSQAPKPSSPKLLNPKGPKSGVLIATDNHPFWVAGDINAWGEAADLKPGMWLRTSAGTYVQVTATQHRSTHHRRVHNLTIADTHTYYVVAGARPVLVHNQTCGTPSSGKVSNPGTRFDVPDEAGVYTIHMDDGSKYVGSSVDSMRTRVNK
ncbi:polymorphic toxin-type HINT domain-containing protein [Actinomadura formosensis]|uniref:polymorphic toxin-type HINT domain-containing protein n=1 Tax=Actinomadura formosensis TaxID=60706 RepID=UPI001F5EE313|nr:polymorphic toxin-type HINT domain-containing protein [Actinomadura formosensis]